MGRSLKYDIPGIDPRVSPSDVAERGWIGLFARLRAGYDEAFAGLHPGVSPTGDADRDRVLEIGFGRGEFLLGLASAAPDTDFIGLEISFKRTLKMARKVARAGLRNVLLMETPAEVAIRGCFAADELAEVWINFSDPWPKARHAPRRLIQPDFVAELARVLAPGGALHVATDDVPYAHQIDAVLSDAKTLENALAPWPFVGEVAGRSITGYEAQWREQSRPLHFFEYRRRVGDGSVSVGGRA